MEPNILRVDNSRLSSFRSCYRKGYYRYEKGLVLPRVDAPLNFGGAIHAGIAHFLRGHTKDEAIAVAFKSMRPQNWDEKEWRTPNRVIEVLDKVLDSPLPKPMLAPTGEPIIEADFSLPLWESEEEQAWIRTKIELAGYTDGPYYEGIVDLLGVWDSRELVVDHKTTSYLVGDKRKGEAKSIPSKFFDSFRPHAATPMYCWGASKIIGHPIRSVLINGIGVNATDLALANHTFELTPSEIEEARKRCLIEVACYLDAKAAGTIYQQFNPDRCNDYGKPCPYLQLCRVPPQNREQLEGLYETSFWDPLEARKKESEEIS